MSNRRVRGTLRRFSLNVSVHTNERTDYAAALLTESGDWLGLRPVANGDAGFSVNVSDESLSVDLVKNARLLGRLRGAGQH
jgi:hypothetical protein